MSNRTFFDTNILVYRFDSRDPYKRERARVLMDEKIEKGSFLISTQVLQEFYVIVTRKLAMPLDSETAYQVVQKFSILPLVQIDGSMVLSAIKRSRKDRLSFWDSLIIQAAIEGGAQLLYTEDLQDGRTFENLRVENPFR